MVYFIVGLVALYLFYTDMRFFFGFTAISAVIYVLEKSDVIPEGPHSLLVRLFLAVGAFVIGLAAAVMMLRFLFGG
jgi:hypothetical protein